MKTIIHLLFVCITVLNIISCGVHRQVVTHPPAPKYDRQTIARLSKQFGLPLTTADNLTLYNACSSWIGVKYRYGGNTKSGVDCSGFVGYIYRQVYGVKLERNSANMLKRNCISIHRNNLREGDLVFFRTTGSKKSRIPNHVGLYLKNGKFIHASSSRGVVVSQLSEAYYVRSWISGGRVKR